MKKWISPEKQIYSKDSVQITFIKLVWMLKDKNSKNNYKYN